MKKNDAVTSQKIKYTIDRKSFFGHSAILFLAMAAVFRVIGCWGYWKDMLLLVMHLAIPVVSCILLILCISFLGKKGFFLSCVPVILGAAFFVYRAFGFESKVQMVLCILLYLVIAVIYTGTVVGSIHTKWALPPLFGLPFIYHIVIEDIPALNNTAAAISFADGMQEMSILCIMAALFCVGMGLKKHVIATETTIIADAPAAEAAAEPVISETAPVCGVVEGVMQCEGEPVIADAVFSAESELPVEPVLPVKPEVNEAANEE